MKKFLLTTVALVAFALPATAAQVLLPDNPTSITGNFALTPGAAAFEDQVIFEVTGAPQFVVIGQATNTFAGPGDMIQNWVASIYNDGDDNIINNADDELLFGPQPAQACAMTPNCQVVGGGGSVFGAGFYYAEFTGTGSGTSGYAGNISTFAVPGPAVGAGVPAFVTALFMAIGWYRRRKVAYQ